MTLEEALKRTQMYQPTFERISSLMEHKSYEERSRIALDLIKCGFTELELAELEVKVENW